MLDMIAYWENRAGTIPLNPVAGLGAGESHVTVIGDNITVPDQCTKVAGALIVSGVTGVATPTIGAVLSSPSLRATSLPELPTILDCGIYAAATHNPGVSVVAAAAVNNPGIAIPYNDFKEAPIELKAGEALQLLTANVGAPAIEAVVGVVVLTDGVLDCPPTFKGLRVETVIGDVAAAAVAYTWTPSAFVLRQALRAGLYAVVGMKATSPSMIAARLVFGNQGARPGCIGRATGAGLTTQFNCADPCKGVFRYGRLGIWGVFTHTNPPVVESLCSVADGAGTIHIALDVVKIG